MTHTKQLIVLMPGIVACIVIVVMWTAQATVINAVQHLMI